MSTEPEAVTNEQYHYGRLWPDGTFNRIPGTNEGYARREFDEKRYELKHVPESLRPVFGRRRVVTTTETYLAEAHPDES